MKKEPRYPFVNRMTKTQTALGWCYLPFHILIFPVLLSLYAAFSPDTVSATVCNLVYFAVADVFVLLAMFRFLRAGFDALLDGLGFCLVTLLCGLVLYYFLAICASLLLLPFDSLLDSGAPATERVLELAATDYGAVKAMSVFLAPFAEETLFRGVAFGSLRTKSRPLAYVVSTLLFSLYHVWQYALVYQDPSCLLYAISYLPLSIVLAWCYDRTGSLWTSTFFHMAYNALAFSVLGVL